MEKEIEGVRKLTGVKDKVMDRLKEKKEEVMGKDGFKGYGELEKWIEGLGMGDKEQKKYLMFHLILAHSKGL